jgi:hypothetical protein
MWRHHSPKWEKVVSLDYDFVSSVANSANDTIGHGVFTGNDIVGASLIMKNQLNPTYLSGTAYYGAAYSPNQDRIYFAPCEAVVETSWQYIDCVSGEVLTFESGMVSPNPCSFASYSPIENRVYFGRFIDQISPAAVTYVDCSTGVWSTLANSAFTSGNLAVMFSASTNTTYFVPFLVPGETTVTVRVFSPDALSPITMSNPAFGVG